MSTTVKGMQLCRDFYGECVAPLMEKYFPEVPYSAARLGGGSDVLGFDDHRSPDHDWGPQTDLFLSSEDLGAVGEAAYALLAEKLPLTFKGFSTHFVDDYGMGEIDKHPIIHRVRTHSVDSFFTDYIGFNPADGVSEIDWLRTPEQKLRTIQTGGVFHDGLSVLEEIRSTLKWYPDDIWYYLLACQWRRIDQEEPFVGRCGDVGDDLGSKIVAARQVKEIMHVCFYMEREFAPYSKWFGSAFSKLPCAQTLQPLLGRVFLQEHWKDREKILSEVYLILAEMHNDLSITEYLEPKIVPFWGRPFAVPKSERFVDALLRKVQSLRLTSMKRPIGSVNQFIDSTDISCWNRALESTSSVYTHCASDRCPAT